jgi:flagellar biosynthetic protein FliP
MTTQTTPAAAAVPTTDPAADPASASPSVPVRRLVRHYLEMVVAMLVGMQLLGPVAALVPGLTARTDVHAVVMATEMALGMAAWMKVRRHSARSITEMTAAMYVPFVVLLVPYWAGALSGDAVMTWGHVLMLPAMAVPMALRPHEHAC